MLRITEHLDREKKQEHWFQLLAIDNGTPQLTGTLTLRLSVTDVNDNKPIFRKPTFHQLTSQMLVELNGRSTNREVIRIPETLPVGSEVVTLVADDKDEGQNAALEYRLLGFRGNEVDPIGSQWFCLHRKNDSTTLQIAEPLDADIPQSKLWMDNNGEVFGYLVQVKVEAMDSGSPSLSSTVTLLILVENVNDNKPEIAIQFTNPLYFTPSDVFGIGNKSVFGSVQENFMGPSTIAHLTVTDKDIVILASMPQSSITNWDDIYCETNDTRFSLDQLPSMSLLGHTEGSDTVRPSTLSYLYRMTVLQEFDREASEWIFVQVTCVDQVEKDYVRYAFPQGKYPVALNSLTGNLSFPLKIMDINDNAPKFSKDVYHFSVIETPGNPMSFYSSSSLEDSWTVIGQVHATDADSGENQVILYNLLTNPYSAFQIDSSKGIISRTGPLDREADERVELSVEARDQGNPSLSSTCTVVVDIMDINDHPPYWVASSAEGFADYHTGRSEDSVFYFSVSEDTEIGQVIGSIKAIDPDGTSHNGLLQTSVNSEEKEMPVKDEAKITYQLETIEDATVYSISRRTGELRLSRKLDRETRAHYEIRAFAIDNPLAERLSKFKRILAGQHWEKMRSIQYTATATIIITVLDVNDNSPQFEAPLAGQEFHIELNSPLMTPGTTLFTAKAHDADSGENATVNYALDGSGYGLFEIDPTTGVCYIREAILPSTIMKLLANGKIPFTEQVNTMSQMSSTKEERADAFQPPAEMRFVSLSLIVVAYDLGTPKRLNSTRVVRVIWNGQSAKDMHSTHLANAMLGGPYISKLIFSSRPSIPERLLIPLVGGAFLLLIAVCAVLFGISRHRKKTNSILARSYAATTQSTTKGLRVREHWSKLACCAGTIMDDTNNDRQVERECVKENSEKADQTNNRFTPSKPLVAAKYPPVSRTIQPYLPGK
ncbi:unnamed protein product [Dicrocoelium dendriticum]|nr:unnamed protein product [Dicrocoelium dendriticum]